jgi:hypothetical protein
VTSVSAFSLRGEAAVLGGVEPTEELESDMASRLENHIVGGWLRRKVSATGEKNLSIESNQTFA